MYASLFLTLSLFVVAACRRSHHRHRYPSVLGLALRIIPVCHLQWLVGSLGIVARWLPLYRLSSLPATGGGAEEGICHHCCFNRRRRLRLWCVLRVSRFLFLLFRRHDFSGTSKWKENNLKFESAIISNLDRNELNWNKKLIFKINSQDSRESRLIWR